MSLKKGILKPNKQRAKNAITLIWIVLILDFVSLVSSYFQFDLLQYVSKGNEVSLEAAVANDIREQFVAIAYLIAYIISAVTFIQWFRRAYYNLHIKVKHLSYDEGWAAGSWFVPIISWFRPFQIMKELYKETKKLLTNNGLYFNQNLSTVYIGWWWFLWLLNNFIGQFQFRYSTKAETIDELIFSTVINLIDNILGIVLALITIKIIKDYSSVEPLLYEINDENEITSKN
ncbi:MAG: DUF4328 domain-containing protein [Vicingaceae bacterium]